jgi:hypothetical protein
MKAKILPTEVQDYATDVTIFGEKYNLILTVRAIKEIGKKYGGIERLGEVLGTLDVMSQLEDVVWLITTLANQSVLIHNRDNPDKRRDLLEPDNVELLKIGEITAMVPAMMACMTRGMGRTIVSEADGGEKNETPEQGDLETGSSSSG